jgi:hypothetical protein
LMTLAIDVADSTRGESNLAVEPELGLGMSISVHRYRKKLETIYSVCVNRRLH